MAQLRVDLQGRGKVEIFSGARVQLMGHGVQLTRRVPRQVGALRQGLAPPPVGVLGGAALPRAVWIGKDDLDREPLGQLLVRGHLFAAIVRQGLPQQRRHRPECLGEALSGTPRIRPLHSGQDDQPCGPLPQGANGRTIARALDEIAFPVARYRARPHRGGAPGHRRHRRDLTPSIRSPRPRPARLAPLTQRHQQFALQGAAGQHLQAHVEGLGRELCAHVVRIRAAKVPGNLFRRAALGQLRLHVLPEPRIQECARVPARVCAVQARYGWPRVTWRANARLTVLGARPSIDASVRNEWPWARPRLKVSRSSALKCV